MPSAKRNPLGRSARRHRRGGGNPVAIEKVKAEADRYALDVLPIIIEIYANGKTSLGEIAAEHAMSVGACIFAGLTKRQWAKRLRRRRGECARTSMARSDCARARRRTTGVERLPKAPLGIDLICHRGQALACSPQSARRPSETCPPRRPLRASPASLPADKDTEETQCAEGPSPLRRSRDVSYVVAQDSCRSCCAAEVNLRHHARSPQVSFADAEMSTQVVNQFLL
jgi:hypothetical protein